MKRNNIWGLFKSFFLRLLEAKDKQPSLRGPSSPVSVSCLVHITNLNSRGGTLCFRASAQTVRDILSELLVMQEKSCTTSSLFLSPQTRLPLSGSRNQRRIQPEYFIA
jgi:hypothetical protein